MSMTKSELKNAFREAASREFQDVPRENSQIQHEFSPAFEKKGKKLIRRERVGLWHLVNTAPKRVAVFAAALVMLVTTASSVEAIREPVARFLVIMEYTFMGEKTDTIEKEYKISVLPEGFSQTGYFREETGVTTTYENAHGDEISFSQSIASETDIIIDNEAVEMRTVDVAGREVQLYVQETLSIALWHEDLYTLKLVLNGDFNEKGIIDIIQTIE